MEYVFYRGEYVLRNQAVIQVDDRAHRFADGFFESIRIINGKAQFLENHFARVDATIKALKIQPSDLDYFIEVEALPNNLFELNETGKIIDIYTEVKKDPNKYAGFKTLNAQLYVMASIFAEEKNWDDALIQNTKQAIIESTNSNLFLVSNGVLYTPSLTDGCIGGTMRMQIINLAVQSKLKVYECTMTPQTLLSADEVFLTNAIKGIEWVASYRTKPYQNGSSRKLLELLNSSIK
jgi:branched-chain amino acid aminotransferase